MKKNLSIFNSHDEAVRALEELREYRSVDMSKIKLVGNEEIVEDHIYVKSNKNLINAPFIIGTVSVVLVGMCTGLGLFVVPGFDVFYNQGILIGSLAGLEFGVLIGGAASLITQRIVKEKKIVFEHHSRPGRFKMIVEGTEDEVRKIEQIVKSKYFGLSIS